MNGEFTVAQAEQFAARIAKLRATIRKLRSKPAGSWPSAVRPTAEERQTALDYLQRNSLPRLCLLIFNMSEFIYVD